MLLLKKCTVFAFRNRLESCNCERCRDPTEFGSYLSAMKCPKCPADKNSPMLPENPTDPDSVWVRNLCLFLALMNSDYGSSELVLTQ